MKRLRAEKAAQEARATANAARKTHQAALEKASQALKAYQAARDKAEGARAIQQSGVQWTPRIAKDKGSSIDYLQQGGRATPGGRSLSKSAPSLTRRSLYALTDGTGKRIVVSIKNNKITALDADHGALDVGNYSKFPKLGDKIIGPGGEEYRLTNASTQEIEASSDIEYHKNALIQHAITWAKLRDAKRNAELLEAWKADPEFNNIAVNAKEGTVPKGWKFSQIPQFNGYAFEPRVAYALDDFYNSYEKSGDVVGFMTKANHLLVRSLFFNPIIHSLNVANHWVISRGFDWVRPGQWQQLYVTGQRAIKAVTEQNKDYIDMLNDGGAMMLARTMNGDLNGALLKKMTDEMARTPGMWSDIADTLGFLNPAKMIESVYKNSAKGLWGVNDILLMQRIYELEGKGLSRAEAIHDAERHIPNYRVPPTIAGSRALSTLMTNPNLTAFGRYHYGVFRAYAETIKDLVGPEKTGQQRLDALGQLLTMGLIAYGIYPLLDRAVQYATDNPDASVRRFGANTIPHSAEQVSTGEKDFTAFLAGIITPPPATEAAAELFFNKDFFTGKPIYSSRDITDGNLGQVARDVVNPVVGQIAPFQSLSQADAGKLSMKQFLESLVGVQDPSAKQVQNKQLHERYAKKDQNYLHNRDKKKDQQENQ